METSENFDYCHKNCFIKTFRSMNANESILIAITTIRFFLEKDKIDEKKSQTLFASSPRLITRKNDPFKYFVSCTKLY